jgi:hypothetical protein
VLQGFEAKPCSQPVQESMAPNPQKRRTPEEIRAGNKRLGLVMVLIAAVFFLGIVVRQYLLSRG